jgi:hypothetical protein
MSIDERRMKPKLCPGAFHSGDRTRVCDVSGSFRTVDKAEFSETLETNEYGGFSKNSSSKRMSGVEGRRRKLTEKSNSRNPEGSARNVSNNSQVIS